MASLERKNQYPKDRKKYFQTYVAVFEDPLREPRRKRISLQTKNKSEARRLLSRLEQKYKEGEFDPWTNRVNDVLAVPGEPTVYEAVSLFLDDRREYCSASTCETYQYVLGGFVKHQFGRAPDFPVRAVQERHIKSYLRRTVAEPTRYSYQQRLHIFFRWCIDQGLCKNDPVPPTRRSKISRRRNLPEYMTEDQYENLVELIEQNGKTRPGTANNQWLLDAVQFAVFTGLRRAELCNLKWQHVDMVGGFIRVANTEYFTTKSGRERRVPLKGRALETVERLAASHNPPHPKDFVFAGGSGSKLNGHYLSKRFRHYRKMAGLPDEINFHSLRHTFASWAVQRGMRLYYLKEILGHADIKQTQVYASLSPDTLENEMEMTFGITGTADRRPAPIQAKQAKTSRRMSQKSSR